MTKLFFGVCCVVAAAVQAAAASGVLRVLPSNPHYFEFRGKPTVLVTSGEHYGAVLNLDFDGARYVETLAGDGLNLTRVFTGAYVEPMGAFGIVRNTLAPGPGRFITPWARSGTTGYAGGGGKFDLSRWDGAYFERLRAFVGAADHCGVVVEVNLFCPFYEEAQWALSPQNAVNNVNGVGAVARTNVYTLDRHGGLLAVQEAMVRKVVQELNPFGNVYYEICNEPYFGGVTLAWQHRIAEVIAEAEKGMKRRHLISRNVANGSEKVKDAHPAISVFNFHYAHPPVAVAENWVLNRPLGDNETGFRGTNDLVYRVEAWSFLLAGGALFNHLDYSFVAGHEDGTFVYPASQPGGGNAGFRRQLGVLAGFMRSLDFARMEPMGKLVLEGKELAAYGLARPGRDYAVYVGPVYRDKGPRPDASGQSVALELEVVPGRYRLEWLDPVDRAVRASSRRRHEGGRLRAEAPVFREDIVLRLRR